MSRQSGVLLTAFFTASTLLLGGGPVGAATTSGTVGTTKSDTVELTAASTLVAGEQIDAGSRMSSPNGQFHLAVQTDGNAVVYVTKTNRSRWSTNTLGATADRLLMQADGNLVLYSADGSALWASNTAGHSGAQLAIENDGRVVLVWEGADHVLAAPASELARGESLVPGQALVSPEGQFSLTLQADGNLVETNADQAPVWASGTHGDTRLVLEPSGDVVIRAGASTAAWSTRPDAPDTRLVLQDDGNFVLYAGEVPIWSRGADERKRSTAAIAAAASTVRISPGDDYPDQDATACGEGVYCKFGAQYSPRGFAYRNCTNFVAWKLDKDWSQIADGRNGHAMGWKQGWIERGRSVGTTATVGSVAWWSRGTYGHVAYVVGVTADGSAVVEQYNAGGGGGFSTQTVRAEAYLY